MRHRYIIKRKQNSILDTIKGAHDAWSGWLCVLLVGLVTGTVAGIVDIGSSWMSDLKFGICPDAFWLNMEQCCWSSNETTFGGVKGNCSQVNILPFAKVILLIHLFICFLIHTIFDLFVHQQWRMWSEIFGSSRVGFWAYIVSYLLFVIFALSFAALAAGLVRVFAPYACGSGVPEVNITQFMLFL